MEHNNNCIICLEQLHTSIVALTCGHVFHDKCVSTWLKNKCICPLCKQLCAKEPIPLLIDLSQFQTDPIKALTQQCQVSTLATKHAQERYAETWKSLIEIGDKCRFYEQYQTQLLDSVQQIDREIKEQSHRTEQLRKLRSVQITKLKSKVSLPLLDVITAWESCDRDASRFCKDHVAPKLKKVSSWELQLENNLKWLYDELKMLLGFMQCLDSHLNNKLKQQEQTKALSRNNQAKPSKKRPQRITLNSDRRAKKLVRPPPILGLSRISTSSAQENMNNQHSFPKAVSADLISFRKPLSPKGRILAKQRKVKPCRKKQNTTQITTFFRDQR